MKNRYMLVKYFKKPNGKWDEVTEFKNNLKDKQLQESKVILDLKENKIIKNNLNNQSTFEETLDFFKKTLGDKLKPYLD